MSPDSGPLTCLACASAADVKPYFEVRPAVPQRSSWGVPLQSRSIFRCSRCGLVFAAPSPLEHDPTESMYGGEYHDLMDALHDERGRRGVEEQIAKRLRLVTSYCKEGLLLDVGCSRGTFLVAARRAGFEVRGLDVSAEACEAARTALACGDDVVERSSVAESALLARGAFDAITMWDVIEHLDEPLAVLERLRSRLKPTGCLFIRTPDFASPFFVVARWLRWVTGAAVAFPLNALFHQDHNFFFGRRSLSAVLERAGLRVVRIEADPLVWKRFRYAECRHGTWTNLGLIVIYWVGRMLGRGHGMVVVATPARVGG
jgi:2-polyprenyl-3-methyl-5-hydroxy-6-metoxy-1,4-benzoquinol methylase